MRLWRRRAQLYPNNIPGLSEQFFGGLLVSAAVNPLPRTQQQTGWHRPPPTQNILSIVRQMSKDSSLLRKWKSRAVYGFSVLSQVRFIVRVQCHVLAVLHNVHRDPPWLSSLLDFYFPPVFSSAPPRAIQLTQLAQQQVYIIWQVFVTEWVCVVSSYCTKIYTFFLDHLRIRVCSH